MLFLEPIWLSILLPISFALALLIASLAVRHWGGTFDKALVLSSAGLALAWAIGGPLVAALVAGSVLLTHWIAFAIERVQDRGSRHTAPASTPARAWLAAGIAVQVAVVAVIARAGFTPAPARDLRAALVPFGVSFFAFHAVSYLIDVYRRRAAAEPSRWQLGVHLLLLPQIVGGPLAYETVSRQLARHLPSLSDYSYGVRRLVIGAWKVLVMAYFAGRQADAIFALRPAGLTAFQAWLGLVSFTVQIYYAFSGYSDMGIGLARMVGIRLPENFRWPYVAETVREFWRRWHIGLSGWFRDYADLPLEADRIPPPSAAREALVVLLCAVWYGVGWTFIVWGLYHAVLIALEWAGLEAAVRRLPPPLRHLYLVAAVMFGWVILRSSTIAGALQFLAALAGQNPPPARVAPPVGVNLWLVLGAGAIGCAPLFSSIRRWTVAIDSLIVSLLMMLFAACLFAWRGLRLAAAPVVRGWSMIR